MIKTLNNSQARELLQSARVARLGCIANGEPYITPINYSFDGDCIYSHSLAGLKIAALRSNPRACIQVDRVESDLRWKSVLAFGNFEEIVKPSERKEVLNKLLNQFPMLTPVESAIAEDAGSQEVIVFRIKVDRITGVSER
ncbi:MAG TPA: pyridoxamine 5'-phosphate oxidase family protein [Pyrinomonadaceae bacterium]|nr:pyridoxamine 5'-phosphate oxidase family protein [Pyrinomonadaceae bacterium]